MDAGRANNTLCCPRALVYFTVGTIVVTMLCVSQYFTVCKAFTYLVSCNSDPTRRDAGISLKGM